MIICLALAPPIGHAERARDPMSTQEWYSNYTDTYNHCLILSQEALYLCMMLAMVPATFKSTASCASADNEVLQFSLKSMHLTHCNKNVVSIGCIIIEYSHTTALILAASPR